MPYAVLLLAGASGDLGQRIARELALQRRQFSRVAWLLYPRDRPDARKEEEASSAIATLEQVTGEWSEPRSYRGFDIVVSAVGEDLCLEQKVHMDAAVAGGVKHFYPEEYGADLGRDDLADERCFRDQLQVRRHLEAWTQKDPSLGYTYIMTGIRSDVLLESDMLGLSDDQSAAKCLGSPDAKVSVTHGDDVAKLVALTLLPSHLARLDVKRHVRCAGSTLATSSLFDALAYVLDRPISLTFDLGLAESLQQEKREQEAGHEAACRQISRRRTVGMGGWEVVDEDHDHDDPDLGQSDESRRAVHAHTVLHLGREFQHDLRPKGWAEVVWEHFGGRAAERGKTMPPFDTLEAQR